jgi:hypothetical protein
VSELDRYKRKVREVAIRVADEQGWCNEGLNEVLEELDLDPFYKTRTFDVEVVQTATRSVTITVEVEAENVGDPDREESWESEARDRALEKVDGGLVYWGTWRDHDNEVEDVTEQ